MKQTLFITGTNAGVGKTVLTALLTRFLHKRSATPKIRPTIFCEQQWPDCRPLQRSPELFPCLCNQSLMEAATGIFCRPSCALAVETAPHAESHARHHENLSRSPKD